MTMKGRGIRWAVGILALGWASAGWAQDNLDQGKSGAQLYASDCAICHKSVQGLSRAGGLFGLESFLREHYTASRESAAVIAAYLKDMDRAAPPAAARGRTPKRTAKGDEKAKAGAKKPEAGKAGEAKSGQEKGSEPKSTGSSGSGKPAETKPSEAKASEPKPAEPKTSEPKASEAPKPE